MAFIQNSAEALDVDLQFPGDRFPVIVGPTLRASGWRGGLWVMYTAGDEDFTVEVSDGTAAAGFLLFESEDYPDGSPQNWISAQPRLRSGGQNVVTMINGGTRAYFKVFETVALSGGTRSGGAITYSLNDDLKVSENGLLCNDPDAELNAAGIASPIVVGIVSAVPATRNGDRLGMDMKY